MKKLFGLFLLALACWVPSSAWAVNCFWVGGTGTWDSTSTAHWAPTTGAAATGCQTTNAAPAAGDAIIFDANFGTGTMTADGTISGISFLSLTAAALTGGNTLNFNTNNPNMSFSSSATALTFSGSGTRTINMGSGTWTLSNGGSFDCATTTTLTPTFSNAALVLNGNISTRLFAGGGQTYGAVTFGSNSTKGWNNITGTNTFASLTVSGGNTLGFPQGVTTIISGALAMSGSSSAQVGLVSSGLVTNNATISVGSASTIDWGGILRITRAGAGTLTATNSFDMGSNTSVTSITPPSGGGGGGGRIIGG